MADDIKPSDGGNVKPDGPTLDELKAQLAKAQADAAAAQAAAAAEKERLDKLIAERQADKEKARKVAEQAGEVERLKQLYEEQIAEMKSKYPDGLLEEHAALKKAAEEQAAKRKTELLAQLPEDRRAEFETFGVDALEKVVTLIGKVPNVDTSKSGKLAGGSSANWFKMTAAQQADYAANHTSAELIQFMRESRNANKE